MPSGTPPPPPTKIRVGKSFSVWELLWYRMKSALFSIQNMVWWKEVITVKHTIQYTPLIFISIHLFIYIPSPSIYLYIYIYILVSIYSYKPSFPVYLFSKLSYIIQVFVDICLFSNELSICYIVHFFLLFYNLFICFSFLIHKYEFIVIWFLGF